MARLRESEARYRLIAEHAQDVLLQYDTRGDVQYASPSVARFGLTPDDLVGRNLLDLAHPDDVPLVRTRLEAARAGKALSPDDCIEVRFRCGDGSWRWVQGSPAPMFDESGRTVGVISIMRDMTERRRLEEQVRESELRYRQLAEQSADLIVRYDVDGDIEYVSQAARQFGIDPDRVVGRNFRDIVSPEDHARNEAFFAELRAGRAPPQGDLNIWRTPLGGGRYVDFEGATSPILDGGRVVGAVAVLRDVTARVALQEQLAREQAETAQALERLQESEARYRALAENASDVIVRVDMASRIEFISPAVGAFGYRPEDMVGRSTSEFVHPGDQTGAVLAAVQAGEALPSGSDNEFRMRCADGGWVLMQGRPAALHNDAGEPIGYVTVLRDISQQRRLEDELRRKEAEAQAAALAKSEFLATMSHEIRTPLTAVVGFADLLARMAALPEKARVYVDRIGRSGEALTSIVNNVLDFSKIEAGQVALRPEPFDLQAFVEEALGVVQDGAEAKGLKLSCRVEAPASGQVLADAGRLRQVVLNLLTNAVKFTHQGEVTLLVTHDPRTRTLEMSVTDTGIGIAQAAASRLFQRFSQIESSNARRFGGAGLGLAISRALVELMGGEIGVESVEGRGSRFWFRVCAPAAGAAAQAAEPELAGPPAGARVLIVDDAPANRELILALLGPFDLQLSEAADGLEALEAAARTPFDLVLMDLQMPGMDGMDAARAIRGGDLNRQTPIVAVSASVQPSDVDACREAGMDDHIGKPISARELVGKVAYWIGAPQGPSSARATG
ncbi:PAS domain S-box protein [Phenylobacterium sp.]|uniref:PAS domain S-box protein n=1 Tax=Phenylobacterium sp. TaxID=1871053 RepID=UPI002EDA70E7